ncbi:MAG TPA: DUF4349 domain-containing protein [Jatrophihabitans sp.]|jgi:hypothetical protein|uniref:DUF4349 domain-containing protein n=1 Tax=Jatrophihabitans sp. TaxID=1932789 RepID=UPI002DF9F5C8|nr:DUF4349 domain-containing protein [Jatrophihabitans sp.]
MRRILLAGGALLAVATVAACTSSSGSSGSSGKADSAFSGAGVAKAAPPAAPSAAAGGRAALPPVPNKADAVNAPVLIDDGVKIRIATITVAVKGPADVSTQADRADDIAVAAGGTIDVDERSSGPDASATLRFRVPPDALRTVLSDLSKLGKELSRGGSIQDVTQQVADVNSRVLSAQRDINGLRLLYAQAHKISDFLAVENELSSREADLESLQAQQRALARQTDAASVTLYLQTAAKPVTAVKKQTVDHHNKLVTGLIKGWDAFTAAAVAVAAAIGAALPFLVLLALVLFALRRLWPRLPRRPGPTPTPAPSE